MTEATVPPTASGYIDVPSHTRAGLRHRVYVDRGVRCSCEAARFGRDCRHAAAVRALVERVEADAARRPAPAAPAEADPFAGLAA